MLVIHMSCFAPHKRSERTDKVQLIRKLVDGLTLQLKRAPFHAMADAITLSISDMFPRASLAELYVLTEDGHLSLMSQHPQLDQEHMPSLTKVQAGGALATLIRTRESVLLGPDAIHVDRGHASTMCVPWIQQGTVEGFILVASRQPRAFDAGDLEWLQLLAAISNTFSLATKVSSEIRRTRRSSVVPDYISKSSLSLQKYQASSSNQPPPPSELQESRILE